jgi:hypothetical protein
MQRSLARTVRCARAAGISRRGIAPCRLSSEQLRCGVWLPGVCPFCSSQLPPKRLQPQILMVSASDVVLAASARLDSAPTACVAIPRARSPATGAISRRREAPAVPPASARRRIRPARPTSATASTRPARACATPTTAARRMRSARDFAASPRRPQGRSVPTTTRAPPASAPTATAAARPAMGPAKRALPRKARPRTAAARFDPLAHPLPAARGIGAMAAVVSVPRAAPKTLNAM